MPKQQSYHYLLLFISLSLYFAVGYGIRRYETLPLFFCYYLLFLIYVWIIVKTKEPNFWILSSILFRALLLFSVPALSDDFYRFVWDGRLLAAGHHPFAEVPAYYINHNMPIPGLDSELYNKLNSKIYFTVYPTLAQFIFWLSVKISPDSIYGSMVVIKGIVFGFEIGTIFLLTKILSHYNIAHSNILIYALNPLVILELTGNLHLEGVMIFFLLLAIYFLLQQRWALSTVFYALSVSTKLIPLIFLPLLLRQLGWKKAIQYWLLTGIITVVLFLPLVNADILNGFTQGIGYYFRKFEFNASIYYLVREAGYSIFGYNIIHISGWVLALISATLIFIISFRRRKNKITFGADNTLFTGMLWCLLIFSLLTPTLHPWYVISFIMICLFTPYRFPVLWSGLIFMTYAGYTPERYNENLLIVAVEYFIVIGYLLYETIWMNRTKPS